VLKVNYKKAQYLRSSYQCNSKNTKQRELLQIKATTACHVPDLNLWLAKDLDIFKQYLASLEIPKGQNKKLVKLYTLGLISYNAIDSIADEESDAKDLNIFLSMLLEYKIIFDELSKQSKESVFLEKLNNSVNRQYLQCANDPQSISYNKIQGIRSIPYIIPFVLARALSSAVSNQKSHTRDIIKCCFCFCSIRQTSDDLKDLSEDIKNNRTTLPTILYSWQGKPLELSDIVKLKIAEKSLLYCKEKLIEIDAVLSKYKNTQTDNEAIKIETLDGDSSIILIVKHWHNISYKIILGMEKYCEILSE